MTARAPYGPELRLLLSCARFRSPGDAKPLPTGLDWDRLRSLASWHALEPVLFRRVREERGVPGAFLASLAGRCGEIHRTNLSRTAELLQIVGLLEDRRIPVLPLKGPVLAHKLHGTVALRAFRDLDLLVPREGYPDAEAALVEKGCRAGPLSKDAGAARERAFRTPAGTRVELHWSLHWPSEGFRIDHEALWSSPATVHLCGRELRDLPDETWVVLLAIHGARHAFFRLHWLTAVADLIEAAPGLDWARVAQLAGEWQARRALGVTLDLLDHLLDVRVPAAGFTPPPMTASLSRKAERRLAGPWPRVLGEREGHAWQLLLQDHWSDRSRYAAWVFAGASRRLIRRAGMGRRALAARGER